MARDSAMKLRLVPVGLGLGGMLLSIALGALGGTFHAVHYAMLAVSLLSIAGGLLWMREARWRETLASFVYSLFFVICAMLLYLISANRMVRLDLTRNRMHTLSPQTVAVLRALPLDQRVVAHVFVPSAEQQAMTRFLEPYVAQSAQFQFQLHDAGRDLDVVQQFGGAVEEKSLHLFLQDASGKVLKKAAPEAFSLASPTREHILTNGIARLMRVDDQKLYYVTGHGEKVVDKTPGSLSKVVRLLTETTLPVSPLRLTEGRIPDDTAALIIAGPTRDIFDFEKELLINYLDGGGKVLFLLDPQYANETEQPNMDAVLAHIGLKAPNQFIVDPLAVNVQGSSFTPLILFASHAISKATNQKQFYLDRARPIASTEKLPEGMKLDAVLVTSAECWAEPADKPRSIRALDPPKSKDEIGQMVVAVAAEKPIKAGRYGDHMRAVVVGDSDAFQDAYYEQNGDAALFVRQSVNWLREQEDLLQIPPRFLESTPITLTKTQAIAILGLLGFVGLAIVAGGTAWTLHRRKTR